MTKYSSVDFNEMAQKKKIVSILFLCTFFVYYTTSFIQTTLITELLPTNFFKYFTYLIFIVLIFIILLKDYSFKMWLLVGISVLTGILIWRNTGNKDTLMALLFIFACKNEKFTSVLQIYLISGIVLTLVTILFAHFGVIVNLVYYRDGISRNSLGFIYPTDFAAHIFYLCVGYAFLRGHKGNLWDAILLLFIAILVNKFTDARLDTICIIVTAILIIIHKLFGKKISVFLSKGLMFISPIMIVILLYLTYSYNYSSQFLWRLNSLLSGRLSLGHEGFVNYGIHFLGTKIIQIGSGGIQGNLAALTSAQNLNYFYLDSSFINTLINYGLIAFFILLLTLYLIGQKGWESNNEFLMNGIFLVILSSLVDQHILVLAYNPFLLTVFAESDIYILI